MRLNQECIRDLMLYIEEKVEYETRLSISDIKIKNYTLEEIAYTVKKLKEANYIHASFTIDRLDEMVACVGDITWEGHKFLDTIRDNQVWSKTKKILSKFSSTSITLVSNISSQVITNLINQQLGLSSF